MNRFVLTLICALLYSLAFVGRSETSAIHIPIQQISTDNGLSHTTVLSIYRDEFGFVCVLGSHLGKYFIYITHKQMSSLGRISGSHCSRCVFRLQAFFATFFGLLAEKRTAASILPTDAAEKKLTLCNISSCPGENLIPDDGYQLFQFFGGGIPAQGNPERTVDQFRF